MNGKIIENKILKNKEKVEESTKRIKYRKGGCENSGVIEIIEKNEGER